MNSLSQYEEQQKQVSRVKRFQTYLFTVFQKKISLTKISNTVWRLLNLGELKGIEINLF